MLYLIYAMTLAIKVPALKEHRADPPRREALYLKVQEMPERFAPEQIIHASKGDFYASSVY